MRSRAYKQLDPILCSDIYWSAAGCRPAEHWGLAELNRLAENAVRWLSIRELRAAVDDLANFLYL